MKMLWLCLVAFAVCFFTACSSGSDKEEKVYDIPEEEVNSIPDDDLDKNRDDLGLENSIVIKFINGSAVIDNPYKNEIITSIDKEDVVVQNVNTGNTKYNLVVSGTANAGSLKIYGESGMGLYLNGVNITNPIGPAINIQGRQQMSIHLVEGTINVLEDGANYQDGTEKAKGTFYSRGTLHFFGNGNLETSGKYAHAIVADKGFKMESGNITINNAVKDGIHASNNIYVGGGSIKITSEGDGIQSENLSVHISSGTINIQTKGIKSHGISSSDSTVISGNASLKIEVLGNGSKGIKSDGFIAVKGGTVDLKTSGDADVDNSASPVDTSTATGIKTSGNMEISGGAITITSSGKGGRGISADGNIVISGSATFVDITTTGEVFGSSSSGGNMGRPPMMMGNSGKGAKAVKAKGKLIINDGNIKVFTTGTEAEGLESKDTLTINGGVIEVKANDDGINASKHLAIKGGKIYVESTTNDGIDSNGTMEIGGGIIVSVGSTSPEEGFDCDNNTFKITGGIMIGIGGATSNPTSSVSTQNSLVYNAPAQTRTFRIEDSSGKSIFTFSFPRTYGNARPVVLFSNPNFKNGTYTLKTGGTISGGYETWHGIYESATYSGGTSISQTISNRVTTVRN